MAEAAAKRHPQTTGPAVVKPTRPVAPECPPHHLGDAVTECTRTHVTFDRAQLLTLGSHRPKAMRACGIVKVGFPVRGNDYAGYEYDER